MSLPVGTWWSKMTGNSPKPYQWMVLHNGSIVQVIHVDGSDLAPP